MTFPDGKPCFENTDGCCFHTVNLRKSYGFYPVSQVADPIPDAEDADEMYLLSLRKKGMEVLRFCDDCVTYGSLPEDGCIGLRRPAPMAGEYKGRKVYSLRDRSGARADKRTERITL